VKATLFICDMSFFFLFEMRIFGCTDSFTWSLRLSEVKMKTAVEEMSY